MVADMDHKHMKRPPFAPTHRRFTGRECAEIISRAAPYYIEGLASIPHYAARRDDHRFWQSYVGSRIVAAYELLVEKEGFSLPDAEITYPDAAMSDADRDRILAKPLWQALLNADLAALDSALNSAADPNEPHPYYLTSPLYVAINAFFDAELRRAAVSALLRAGADVRGAEDGEETLISAAYFQKDAAVMRLLLDHGADPNHLMGGGQVIYDHAEVQYRYQHYYLEVPVTPRDTDVQSELAWLDFLERVAGEVGTEPPVLVRLLWDRGARPRVALLERVSGSREEQEERAAARFQAAVAAARTRRERGHA